jgi:hypothetical protein
MKTQNRNSHFEPSSVSDLVLRLLLGRRRWESVSGDLLEECREVILPARGQLRARAWYWNQVFSFTTPFHLGFLLGLLSAAIVVLSNVVLPMLHWEIATDSLLEKLCSVFCFGGSFLLWAGVGGLVRRRGEGLKGSLYGGAITAVMQMSLVMITFVIVNNLFLNIVALQPEKIWGLQHSGEPNMRVYVNHAAMRGVLFVLPAFVALGALCGTAGGSIVSWSSSSSST